MRMFKDCLGWSGLLLAGMLVTGLLLAGHAAPLHAQESSVQSWRVIQTAPVVTRPPAQNQTYRARRRYDAPRPRFPDEAALGLIMPEITVALPEPADSNRPKVVLIGDSLADALSAGFMADPGLKAELNLRAKTVSASGLVRDDFHDWPRHLREMLVATPDAAAIIVMLGLNDRQPLRAGEASLEPLSEPWQVQYRQRIDGLLLIAQQARIPLIWVGMPVMRSGRLSQDIATLNGLIRDRVTQAGETYVETYDSFADSSGGFTATGPDVIGDTVRLRGPDGIHFTPAGQRKLAFFVERPLRLRMGDRLAVAVPPPGIAPPPVRAPESTTPSPAAPPPTERSVVVLPPVAPAAPVRIRPDIGETRPLSVPATASALAGVQAPAIHDPATRDLFEKGRAPLPRPGRADDYRWR